MITAKDSLASWIYTAVGKNDFLKWYEANDCLEGQKNVSV